VVLRSTDGILASDETSKLVTQSFPGFGAIQAAITERRGHWFVPEIREKGADGAEGALVEPRRFVGFAAVEQVPGVQWLVAVEQDADEAEAPILGVTRYLWIHFIGAFLTVILLALYFVQAGR
jgi:hypothetical protein